MTDPEDHSCTMTFHGTGACDGCGLSLRPQIGQELRLEHLNALGRFCSGCCKVCRLLNEGGTLMPEEW
jgi:hypothetical protein